MRGRHEDERGSKPTCRSSWRKVGWTVSWRSRMPRVETKKLGADGKQVHPNPVEIRGAHRPALGDRGAHLVSSLDGYHLSASCILIPKRALTLAPEAGAQCRNSARWDLRGGRPQGRSLPRSGPSTAPSCTPSLRASTSTSSDRQCRSSNDYEDVPTGNDAGWMRHGCDSRSSSPIGISSPHRHAGLWEPYDGIPSRTVLREREGEGPSRYSPPQLEDPSHQPPRLRAPFAASPHRHDLPLLRRNHRAVAVRDVMTARVFAHGNPRRT